MIKVNGSKKRKYAGEFDCKVFMQESYDFRMEDKVEIRNEEEGETLASVLKKQIQLGKIPKPDKSNINLLISGLALEKGLLRRSYTEGLALIGEKSLPALTEALLKNPNVVVRRAAAKTIKLVGDPNSIPVLVKALTTDLDPVVKGSAAAGLAIFDEDAVLPLLEVLTRSNNDSLQAGLAIWAIRFIGSRAYKILTVAASSENELVRVAAISSLGEQIQSRDSKDSRTEAIIINALKDKYPNVRAEATLILSKLSNVEYAMKILFKTLKDPSPEVRINSALALIKLKSDKAIHAIESCLKSEEDQRVKNIFIFSLDKLNQSGGTKISSD